MNKLNKIFLIILISLLYFYSAYNKITNFNTVAVGLKNKLDSSILFNWIPNFTNYNISKIALVIAIFLLIAGPIFMLYGVSINNNINDSLSIKIGALLLIVFLILATILYHTPNEPGQINNFLKNLSLMGGLGMIIV
jgi:uncharacterized membrane protein YphA (DoxX/SURF4 family)